MLYGGITAEGGSVSISFLGDLSLGQIAVPDVVESNGISVASLLDMFGMKCATTIATTQRIGAGIQPI